MEDRAEMVEWIDKARSGGARAAEVYREASVILEQDGYRARPLTRTELTWRMRVYGEGGRTGVAAGTNGGSVLAEALALATNPATPPDAYAGPAERMSVRAAGLGVDDRRHFGISDEDRGEVLHLAEKAFERSVATLTGLKYRQVRVVRAWLSSRGVEAEESATEYRVSAVAVAGDVSARHIIASRHFSDVASLPFGTELRRRIESLLVSEPQPVVALPVLLDPRVTADLVRTIAPAFAADAVAQGSFIAHRLGQRLAAPTLHVTDDAGLFGGLHSHGFDERGVPPIAVALLKEGVVHGLYYDPESARAHALRPTGHVSGGRLRPANLTVRPGARTRNVILTEIGPHLVLDRLPPFDLHQGRWTGVVPVVVADRHERKGAFPLRLDIDAEALLGAIVELAGDQERCCEVDAPSAILDGRILAR